MGGSSSSSRRRKRSGTRPRGQGGDDSANPCPPKIATSITGPAPGIAAGTWLDVQLDKTSTPNRVLVYDPSARAVVGSIAGIPDLHVLIDCLNNGVQYRAYVDQVVGGRVDITLVRQ